MKRTTNSKISVEGMFIFLAVIAAFIIVLAYIGGYMFKVIDYELASTLMKYGFFGMIFSAIWALSNTQR